MCADSVMIVSGYSWKERPCLHRLFFAISTSVFISVVFILNYNHIMVELVRLGSLFVKASTFVAWSGALLGGGLHVISESPVQPSSTPLCEACCTCLELAPVRARGRST